MALNTVRFLSLLFAALALVPAAAHLIELPHKIHLSAAEYLTVQQIYRGWALAGIVVVGALVSTAALALMLRGRGEPWFAALIAFLSVAATQVVFWTFTDPVNRLTENWTRLPEHWAALRTQWEFSHAVSAGFNLVALICLIVAVLPSREH